MLALATVTNNLQINSIYFSLTSLWLAVALPASALVYVSYSKTQAGGAPIRAMLFSLQRTEGQKDEVRLGIAFIASAWTWVFRICLHRIGQRQSRDHA